MKESNYRIAIVGTSGSGKSTLARKVSDVLECDHIEMDNHYFLPDWEVKDKQVFIESISKAMSRKNWVACGNYSLIRDQMWTKATHLVWLKLPFHKVFRQAFWRTIKRIYSKEKIAGENKETIRRQFFSRNSIFLWVITTHRRRARVLNKLIEENAYPNLKVSILRSNKEIQNWLENLKEGSKKISQ